MKRRILTVLVLTSAMVLALVLASGAGANATYVLLDSVNIGNTTSEAGHNLSGWTNIWSGCGWCGADGNMRLIWGDGGETCAPDNNWASITLNAGSNWAQTLTLDHLDGAADDGFNVYVNDTLVGTYVDQYPQNTWVLDDDFDISPWHFSGILTVKLEATGVAWGGCGTYGQVAFNEIKLYGAPVPATVDIDPDTLNVKSKGNFITAYIELPAGYDVSAIDVSSILLNATVSAEASPTGVGDYDGDGVPDLMVKFNREAVQAILLPGDSVPVTVTGVVNGTAFEGSDTIRVIDKGKDHTSNDPSSVVY